jgi:hypothetical protein
VTTKQRIAILADWWPAACQAQHWDPKDRPLRLQTISQAIGRTIYTMADLDNAADIDQVKAYLKLLADDLDGAHESGNPDPGERRRLLWLIRRHSAALAIGDRQSAMSYALALARDKYHITEGFSVLEDLSTEQLRQLMMTLWARLVSQRRAAKNASLTSEETFPDQVEFLPEMAHENEPF